MAQVNLVGQTILGYKVVELLGAGAFGTVYKVQKENVSGQYVRALKHIRIPNDKQYMSVLNSMGGDASKADDYFDEMLNRIVSEIKVLNKLSGDGGEYIVRYFENDIVKQNTPRRYDVYILMEYVQPLEQYIQQVPMQVKDVIFLGMDILKGIQHCHDNNVMHRDIKEDNIFVSDYGKFKIGDFGVAKVLKDSSRAESMMGTPNFVAPEVYQGKDSYTKSVDLYSLGIVLYRLLNYMRNPFLPHYPRPYSPEDEEQAFALRMKNCVPDMPSKGGEKLGAVIVKAISSKQVRFQNAEEFLYALEKAMLDTREDLLNEELGLVIEDKNMHKTVNSHDNNETLKEFLVGNKMNATNDGKNETSVVSSLLETQSEQPQIRKHTETVVNKTRKKKKVVEEVLEPESDENEPLEVLDKGIMNKLYSISPVIIAWFVYNCFAFVLCDTSTEVFKICYGFMTVAFVSQVVSLFVSVKTLDAKTVFFGIPLMQFALFYFFAELIVSTAFLFFAEHLTYKAPFLFQIFILGVFLIFAVMAIFSRDTALARREEIKQTIASFKNTIVDIECLAESAPDGELKKCLEEIAEEARYSDPMSRKATFSIESKIEDEIENIQDALDVEDLEDAMQSCKKLERLLAERNKKLIMSK